jgi:hypothetical protein
VELDLGRFCGRALQKVCKESAKNRARKSRRWVEISDGITLTAMSTAIAHTPSSWMPLPEAGDDVRLFDLEPRFTCNAAAPPVN